MQTIILVALVALISVTKSSSPLPSTNTIPSPQLIQSPSTPVDSHNTSKTSFISSLTSSGEIYKTFNHYVWDAARNGKEALSLQLNANPILRKGLLTCAKYLLWSTRQLLLQQQQQQQQQQNANNNNQTTIRNQTSEENIAQNEFLAWLQSRLALDFSSNITNDAFAAAIVTLVNPQIPINENIERQLEKRSNFNTEDPMRFKQTQEKPNKGKKKDSSKDWQSDEPDEEKFFEAFANDGDFKKNENDDRFKKLVGINLGQRATAIEQYKRALTLNDLLEQEKDLALSAVDDLSIATDFRVSDLTEKPWLETPLCSGHNILTGKRAGKICVFNIATVQAPTTGELQKQYKVPASIRVKTVAELSNEPMQTIHSTSQFGLLARDNGDPIPEVTSTSGK